MVVFRSFTFYLGIAGIILSFILIKKINTPMPESAHLSPAINPYKKTIAAAGIIESIDKNIEIGVPFSGLIKDSYVKVGDSVKQGTTLFQLDDRELQAQLLVQKANISVAKAQFHHLREQFARLEAVQDPRAVSQEELRSRYFDMKVAEAQLETAEAQVTQTILLLERLMICAPCDGVILQNNVRKGEFIAAGGPFPAMILGNIEHLQIRADIDEQNAFFIIPQLIAIAFPKHSPSLEIPLHFERIEPYVIPKRSLTGASNERVDTRVLQIIYTFDRPPNFPLYVGQQVDVFIKQAETESLAILEETPPEVESESSIIAEEISANVF